jgi:hypothetical protein
MREVRGDGQRRGEGDDAAHPAPGDDEATPERGPIIGRGWRRPSTNTAVSRTANDGTRRRAGIDERRASVTAYATMVRTPVKPP